MIESKELKHISEDKIKQIKELIIRNEQLDKDTQSFLLELNVTPEQLTAFIENKENFTEKDWKRLQAEKTKLNDKIETEIKSISNPLEVEKKYAERRISGQWIFVR